ncbi:aminodeoxychorismate synthase component I [Dyadobacter flavalbus]|uniref:Aminodeoxychorismate synthase component I n=1 Tax=Dyadobacter flavalbus TaxID=2579942 RepID=A0A5M8R1W6_9BACT|nr:aminodeoxychorismate synthase component I [Dyadobacter flavalbus]KAA6440964.1 aminodeoxychorismate synthase component I [Dyadobacter flavalbus]
MTDSVNIFTRNLNEWGKRGIPFLFIADYLSEKPLAWPLKDVNPAEIQFDFNGFSNQAFTEKKELPGDFYFRKFPVPFEEYKSRFDFVVKNLKAGNSFLVNFSLPTLIETGLSLFDIYQNSTALYKLWFRNEFACFSPEIFVRIKGNRIASFPMKGTIDASVPNAEDVILSDYKEAAEHATIVDLIRNDLSMVAQKIWVEKYRYIDRIYTNDKTLLQVSSEIAGILPDDFNGKYGDLLLKLLPAGSITGAPKPSTMRIIKNAEGYERGYYTGVMGYFDGENFESAVMIRFIENQNEQLIFKSGGGITARSNARSEYQELIDKVYLPFSHVAQTML